MMKMQTPWLPYWLNRKCCRITQAITTGRKNLKRPEFLQIRYSDRNSMMTSIVMIRMILSSFQLSCISVEQAPSIFSVGQCFVAYVLWTSAKSVWILQIHLNYFAKKWILVSSIYQEYLSDLGFSSKKFQILILKKYQHL